MPICSIRGPQGRRLALALLLMSVSGAIACQPETSTSSKADVTTKTQGTLQYTTWNLVGLSASGTGKANSSACVYYRYDGQSSSNTYDTDRLGNWRGNIVFTGQFDSKSSHQFQIVDCATRTRGNYGTVPVQYAAQVPPPTTGFSAVFTNYP